MTVIARAPVGQPSNAWLVFLLIGALALPTLLWPFAEHGLDTIKSVLVIAITGFAILAMFLRNTDQPPWVWFAAAPVITIYMAMIPLGVSGISDGVKTLLQLLLVTAWFAFLSSTPWKTEDLIKLWRFLQAVLVINWMGYFITQHTFEYAGFTPHKNALGSLCFISIYILMILRARTTTVAGTGLIWYLIPLALTTAAHSRAPLIAIGVTAFIYACWPLITKSRAIYILALPAVIGLMLWLCYFYTNLDTYPWFADAQNWLYAHTQQNIYSGRNLIWPILFEAIAERPWFGYGAGARPNIFLYENFLDVTWSAHNLYYTIIIQVGYVGLSAFVVYLAAIWSRFYRTKLNPATRIAGSFFVGLCVYQAFECMLTQNNLDSGLFLWFIPAFGLIPEEPVEQPTQLTNPGS